MEYFNVVPNHILVSELINKNLIKYSICIFDFTHNSFEINLLNNLKSAIISNTYDNLELYCAELMSLIINENVENLKIHAPKLKELYIGYYNNKIEYIDNKYIFELFCPNTITDNQKPVYYEIYSQLTDKDAKQYLIEMLTYGVI